MKMQYLKMMVSILVVIHCFPLAMDISPANINLFTGNVVLSENLFTLKTKGVLSLPIRLTYSSNVDADAHARNDVSPTSWVGLGWNLDFGRIVCNHHNQMNYNFQDYAWVSPDGISYPIIWNYGDYMIKDHPYYQVEPNYESVSAGGITYTIINGWTVVDESGNQYLYGDFSDASNASRSLNWTTLCWPQAPTDGVPNGYVGAAFMGTPQPYPYVWELAEINDPEGNWIKFAYGTPPHVSET